MADGWERAAKRAQRRLERLARKRPDAARTERAEAKAARLAAIVALPADRRPPRPRLSLDVLSRALDVAMVVLSATPAAPAVAAVKAALASARGISKAVGSHDVDGVLDGLRDAVRAELARTGVHLDDDQLEALVDAVDDQLEA